MNQDTFEKTQFNQLKEELRTFAMSNFGKKKIEELQPSSTLKVVAQRLQETQEARTLLEANLHVPFMGLSGIDHLTEQVEKGFVLNPNELVQYADFLRSGRLIKDYLHKHTFYAPTLAIYSSTIQTFQTVEEEIYHVIHHNTVSSESNRELRRIRKTIRETEIDIEKSLQKFLNSAAHKQKIQEFMVVKKQERFTIPIKSSYKNQVNGTIVESSNKGTTVFIEPSSVSKQNDKLFDLKVAESTEIYQVLASLTGMIAEQMALIRENIEVIAEFDVIFARGKYSRQIEGITPQINQEGRIYLNQAEHPFLDNPVPLTVSLGADYRALTITGPNAGGKTIVLKTIALLTLQTMIGLQVKAKKGTEIAVFDQIFVDIGDQQSIENALSTFSGHMQNLANISHKANNNSLLLLDEIGSGTEPNEGAALAIAIMEELYRKGSLLVTTTHYGEIKRFSEQHADFMTAAMAFDSETLQPKYQLLLGEVGESNAFWIAKKMNLSSSVIKKAKLYEQTRDYSLEKINFVNKVTAKPSLTIEKVFYQKGDRIYSMQHEKMGLVYEDDRNQDQLIISIEDELMEVNRQRIKLERSREELYPDNYDFDRLFGRYEDRKMQRDLLRGSKKAHKKLNDEAKHRKMRKD